MRFLASSAFATLALAAAVSTGCDEKNTNLCDDACLDGGIDAPIDAPPVVGCVEDPGVCHDDDLTCVADVCKDCDVSVDDNTQTAACTTAAAPVCGAGNDCRPCTAHDECDGGVCFEGTCPSGVLFVATDGDDLSGSNPCTDRAAPCKTLTSTLTHVPALGGNAAANRRFIRLLSTGEYGEPSSVVIDNKAVWIIGQPVTSFPSGGRSIIRRPGANSATLSVQNSSDVYLESVGIAGGGGNTTAHALACASSTLVARGIDADGALGAGVNANECVLTLVNSLVTRNRAGGISINGTVAAVIVNNIIAENGAGNTPFGGLAIAAGPPATTVVQSNTIVFNNAAAGQADGVKCDVLGLAVQNNIVFTDSTRPRVSGTCTFSNTLYGPTDPNAALGVTNGNTLVLTEALIQFRNASERDYRLNASATPPSAARGLGSLTGLAPAAMTDIEGEMRPQGIVDVGCDEIP